MELTRQNVRALGHFTESRATGLTDTEKADAIVRRNFSLIMPIVAHYERQQQARLTAIEISKVTMK